MSDAPSGLPSEERQVAALLAGDEQAFLALIQELAPSMLRVARAHVATKASAEELVQETWVAVLEGLADFERRCPLRAWIFSILTNLARSRSAREGRSLPFSTLASDDAGAAPAVDPDRFLSGHPRWEGHWASPPQPFADEQLIAAQGLQRIQAAIETLPPAQRQVILLRDLEQWSTEEICLAMSISEGNQRVLLHRARARVRAILEAGDHRGREAGP